ncbi:peptidase [Pochonia chlamydosporia 170]|uniref:Peptidase n=1 Tax=Pochonia chlamydosporia 170 TaxID=1380566 RepID=A0A179EWR9_METCM|nr:peptidase [Pochonia chlamydosporia 170]OAQ57618.1 peptidase [Pochonia chlamydosporia 170]
MVRTAMFMSLLATAATALAAAARVPGGYIVELEDGQDASAVVGALNGEVTTRMKLDYKLFKGVSIQLHDVKNAEKKAQKIAQMPAVKHIWPIDLFGVPDANVRVVGTPGKVSARDDKPADTFSPHIMTQVDKLRAKGITGKGVRVAIIDTGIDYTHPALGNNCFGKGCLVSFGTDLVGDDYTGYNTPVPDNDPMDCRGHGSHVAGIVAAQPNVHGFTGAAPSVTLGAYRVFGCDGRAGTDILISAFNKAFEDGAQIISASIVGARGWNEEPWAVAVSRIVEQGVPCTISAGNDGDHGLFYISTAANGKKVTAVASYDNVLTPSVQFQASFSVDGAKKTDFLYVPGTPALASVSMTLYATSFDTTIANDACTPLPANTPDLSKYIVLVRRGTCLFADKAVNLAAKGAKYMMVYNNVAGDFAPKLGDSASLMKGAGMVTPETGAAWVNSLKAGSTVTLDITSFSKAASVVGQVNNTVTGGSISLFSSWGPTWEMDFKPQIGAPGGNILSTYPVAKGSYAVLSGTSMSCPITAAIIALVSQVRGTRNPELINNLLSATANPQLFNDGKQFSNKLAPAAQQGGGMVQAYDAAYTTSLLSPSSLSFNDTDHSARELNFTISNVGKRSVTYKLNQVASLTMYTLQKGSIYPMAFPNDAVDSYARLKFSQDSVTVAPGKQVVVEVMPTPPSSLDASRLALWSGYITVNGTDGSSLSMPYQGLTGSLGKATVLASDQSWIFNSNDSKYYGKVPNNTTFNLPPPGKAGSQDVLPAVYIGLALGSSQIRVDVVPMTTCPPKDLTTEVMGVKSIGQPFGFPSYWNSRGISWWSWDGKLDSEKYAPAGKYKFVTRALRIYGDAKKKEDWDVASTQSFDIKYNK